MGFHCFIRRTAHLQTDQLDNLNLLDDLDPNLLF